MNKARFYVGIDIAAETFTSAVGQMTERWQIVVPPVTFDNHLDGLDAYLKWLQTHGVQADNSLVCMEATGVYSEVLAHYLVAHGYQLVIEAPLKVKRAFKPVGHKSDPVDSCQISEYAYRFVDQLRLWQPRPVVLEQIQTLLTVRAQLVEQSSAHKHALHALERKAVRTPLAEQTHTASITQLKAHLQSLEAEIKRLMDQDPGFRRLLLILLSAPGVGFILAAHLLVLLQTMPTLIDPKALAAFIGICPYENWSGSSIHHPATSRHYGPPEIRRLLFLGSMCLRKHYKQFTQYFQQKTAEGKPGKLILNNIANKMLKIICAIVRTNTPFSKDYHPVRPGNIQKPLTVS